MVVQYQEIKVEKIITLYEHAVSGQASLVVHNMFIHHTLIFKILTYSTVQPCIASPQLIYSLFTAFLQILGALILCVLPHWTSTCFVCHNKDTSVANHLNVF